MRYDHYHKIIKTFDMISKCDATSSHTSFYHIRGRQREKNPPLQATDT
jgi:hypothetical protein